MKKNTLDQSYFASSMMIILGILLTLKYITVIPVIPANIIGIILGSFSIFFVIYKKGFNSQKEMLLYLFINLFFGALYYLVSGNLDLPELAWPFFYLGFAMVFLNYNLKSRIMVFPVLFFTTVLLILILINGSIYSFETSESRNYLSGYSLLFLSMYIINCNRNNERLNFKQTLIIIYSFIPVLLTQSRGGIASYFIIIFGLIFYWIKNFFSANYYKSKVKIKYVIMGPLYISLATILIIYMINNPVIQSTFERTVIRLQAVGFEDTSRATIWDHYMTKILSSPRYIFYPAPISGTNILNMFEDNLHNSFMMLYARYGVPVFLVVILLLINSVVYLIKSKSFFLIIILISISFRASTDVLAFNGILDIAFYIFMFAPFYNNKENI